MIVALLSIAMTTGPASPPPPRLPASAHAPEHGTPALHRHPDGGFQHHDKQSGFSARIHPDGRVTFKDSPPARMESPLILGYDMRGRKHEPQDEIFNKQSNALVHRGTLAEAKSDMLVNWGPYGAAPILANAGVRFAGVSDLATATRRAHAKRKFLDQTAHMRADLAEDHQRDNEKEALARLHADLRTIWAHHATPLSLRKEKLFELWDECEETLVGEGDSDPEQSARAQAGEAARRQIEAFVRKYAPAGGQDEFTASELRDMNQRRRSHAKFDPYRAPPPSPDETAEK